MVYPYKLERATGITKVQFIVIVFSLILFTSFLSPQIALLGRGLRLSLPVFVLLFIAAIIFKPGTTKRQLRLQIKPLLFGIAFVSTGLLHYLLDPNSTFIQNYLESGMICIGLWISVMIIKNIFHETLESIRWFCLIIFGISLGLGIPLLINMPGVARLTMGNPEASINIALYFPSGVANYGWYTPAAIAWPVIANWLYNSRQRLAKKILGWAALITVSIAVILSTFTMALVLLLAGVLGWFFFVLINSKNLRSRTVAIIILVIFGVSFTSLRLFGSEYGPTSFAVGKATRIFTVFWETNNFVASDPTVRTDLFIETMKTFEENPIFGAWGLSADDFSGGHSSWADTLALFGLFGLFLWFGFLSRSLRRRKHPFSVSEGNAGGTLSWILFLVGGILNPIFYGSLGLLLLWLFDINDLGNSQASHRSGSFLPAKNNYLIEK
jgi:hypothetical protein